MTPAHASGSPSLRSEFWALATEISQKVDSLGLGTSRRSLELMLEKLSIGKLEVAENLGLLAEKLENRTELAVALAQRVRDLERRFASEDAPSAAATGGQSPISEPPVIADAGDSPAAACPPPMESATVPAGEQPVPEIPATPEPPPQDTGVPVPPAVTAEMATEVQAPADSTCSNVEPPDLPEKPERPSERPPVAEAVEIETGAAVEIPIDSVEARPPFCDLFGLDDDSYSLIVENMKAVGYDRSEPVVVWKQMNVVVDGHQRFEAAGEAGLTTLWAIRMSFESEAAAVTYAFKRQLGRRNATDATLLKAMIVIDRRGPRGGDRRSPTAIKPAGAGLKSSAERTGELLGTSETKVTRMRYVLDEGDEAVNREILEGRLTINAAYQQVRARRRAKHAEDPPEPGPRAAAKSAASDTALKSKHAPATSAVSETNDPPGSHSGAPTPSTAEAPASVLTAADAQQSQQLAAGHAPLHVLMNWRECHELMAAEMSEYGHPTTNVRAEIDILDAMIANREREFEMTENDHGPA